ncbi:hypothetical protein niasHS_016395 [Heterodera schachtii]|uniref:B30.2/SPRY domain-containing protein n=1 Tax=Heterodera schachtii TaxID=97005 RepID=A0ABD2I1P3_HETSC
MFYDIWWVGILIPEKFFGLGMPSLGIGPILDWDEGTNCIASHFLLIYRMLLMLTIHVCPPSLFPLLLHLFPLLLLCAPPIVVVFLLFGWHCVPQQTVSGRANAFDNHLHQSWQQHNEEVQLQQHEQKTTTEAAVLANACQTTERQNGGVEEKLSKITPQNIDNEMSIESDSGEDEAEAEQQQGDNGAKKDNGIPPNECLFCGHKSDIWEENVVHMIEQHGFRFPDSPFRTDVLGLLTYLGFKVGVGLTCVGCQCLRFRSLAALRKHMRDSNHCNFCFQSRHEEFLQNEVLLLKAKIVEVENEHNKLLKMLFNNFQQNFWDATACHMELKITGAKCLSVVFQSDMTGYRTVFAVHPILLKLAKFSDIFYYEISIKNMGNHILFGFGMKRMSEKKLCTRKGTYACSSDGTFWINGIRKKQEQAISCYGTDDVVGCGVNLATQQIFFTKNGHKIFSSNFPENIVDVPLFPCVSLCDDDDKITANFGHKFLFDLDDL